MATTRLTADFEKGTTGQLVQVADAGSNSQWDSVGIGGAGSDRSYETAFAAHGSKGVHIKNATSGATSLFWGAQFGSQLEHWGRFYFNNIVWGANWLSLGSKFVQLVSNNTMTVTGGGFTSTALINGQWARIEWHAFHDSVNGFIELRIFLSPDSSQPDEIKQIFAGNTGAAATAIGFGNNGSGAAAVEGYFDQIVVCAGDNASYPGPFPVNSLRPTISGSVAAGSTLHCDDGGWNAIFDLSYQWRRNGLSIAGATSYLYTTQFADVGAVIDVALTATGRQATNESATVTSINTITPVVTTYAKTYGVVTGANIIRI